MRVGDVPELVGIGAPVALKVADPAPGAGVPEDETSVVLVAVVVPVVDPVVIC